VGHARRLPRRGRAPRGGPSAGEAGVEIEVGEFVGAYPDRYGDGEGAPVALNLVWQVTIRGDEVELVPADDVSELRWFTEGELPGDDELAFRWLARCLMDFASRT